MTTDNLTTDGPQGPGSHDEQGDSQGQDSRPADAAPNLFGLLALGEFALHVDLTGALADMPEHAFASGLRVATLSAGRLERARRFAELAGADALEPWRPTVELLREIPAADRFEALVGAGVVGGVLSDLAALASDDGSGGGSYDGNGGDADRDDLAATVRGEVEADPALAGRLSLYGRRVFGRVLLAGREVVVALAEPSPERDRVQAYLEGAGEGFAERMSAMGLKG